MCAKVGRSIAVVTNRGRASAMLCFEQPSKAVTRSRHLSMTKFAHCFGDAGDLASEVMKLFRGQNNPRSSRCCILDTNIGGVGVTINDDNAVSGQSESARVLHQGTDRVV